MILEDEPPIARSIKNFIEAANPLFKVVSCVYDGIEALPILESVKPDVIFTDIRMPVMDGITLISHIRETMPETIIVILSGYQEFEYARKSIQFGVFDYLLKPISVNILTSLLEKIAIEVQTKKDELERSYIYNILNGDIPNYYNKNIEFSYNYYVVILLCAGSFVTFSMDCLNPAKDYWAEFNLENLVSECIDKEEKAWAFVGKSSTERIVILGLNEYCVEKMDTLSERLVSILPSSRFPTTMIISDSVSSIKDTKLVSQFLRTSLNKNIIIGMSQVIKLYKSNVNILTQEETYNIDSYVENRLRLSAQQSNIDMFKSDLKILFENWEKSKLPQVIVEKLLKIIIYITYHYTATFPPYNPSDLELEINESVSNSYSFDELFDNLWHIFENLLKKNVKNTDEKDDMKKSLMQKIDDFIKLNLTEPINNQILSDKFGLVPSYLSKLFKDYKGLTPSEYLTALRIEKAKDLINNRSDILLKDIASTVGYTNQFYFSRVFKKETGLWPSEYKNTPQ